MGEDTTQPSAISATMVTTDDGWLRSVSPQVEARLGWSLDPVDEHNWFDLVHPADTAGARRAWGDVVTTRAPKTVRLRLWSDDRWVSWHLRLRPSDAGLFAIDVLSAQADAGAESGVDSGGTDVPIAAVEPASQADSVVEAGTAARPASPHPDAAVEPIDRPGQVVAVTGVEPIDGPAQAAPAAPPSDPTTPGPDVPARRVLARLHAGGSSTPMVEIDPAGRTLYVGGDWSPLVGAEVSGAEALESLLNETDQANAVMHAMDRALEAAESTEVAMRLGDGSPRWIKVVPIPAPNVAGVDNVLVGVADSLEPIATPEAPETLDHYQTTPSAVVVPAKSGHTATAEVGRRPDLVHGTVGEQVDAARPSGGPAEPRPTLRERVQPVLDWVDRRGLNPWQLAFAGAVVLLALVLRTFDLTTLPTGFHGDEAIFGQEAQRVLDNGSIGVYTGSALGQPTGPFYLGAFTVGIFGPTIFATRILAALAGAITVAAVYLVVQKRFDHRVAAASALALAVMAWNIHFSRIAFGLSWWPLVVLLAIAAVDRATKSGERKHWFIAGGLSALGVYVYNSHWSFGLAVAIFMLVWFFWPHQRAVDRGIPTLLWGPLGALVVLFPMLRFALDDKNGYFNHFDSVSKRNSPEWTEAGFFGKAEKLTGWYLDSWNSLLFEPTGDGVDASGVIHQVPLIFTILAIVGLIEILRRHRTAFTGLTLVTIAILPLGPSMTFDGITRREFAMSPLLAIVAGIGAVALYDVAKNRVHLRVAHVVAGVIVVVMFFSSVMPYFTTFRDDERQKWIFAQELTESVDIIQDVEDDRPVFVNWFSARHYYGYETLAYLLDGTPGVDRAPLDQGFVEEPALGLYPDTTADQLYVLVGDYSLQLDALQQMYPEGSIVADQHGPRVAAYLVPTN